ncbi:MAG: efflux RND transporter periplasmic adaptor subunit [Anaerolineae bacterium]|nr:efflux RND transporter periplasmic adaptor subunit [Anaerolineae bacterium]
MKKKNKNKRIMWIVIGVVVVAAVVLGGGWLVSRRVRAESSIDPGQVVTAFIGTLSAEASASGQLLPQQEAKLAFSATGRVEQVLVDVGDQVRAGDVLIRLESDALERAVRTAEQNLAIQQANLAALLDGASLEELDAAQAAVQSAQTQLDDLLAGPSDQDLAAAQAAVVSAQAQLDDLLAGPSEEDLERARAALASALAVEQAEAKRYAALDAQLVVARQQLDLAAVNLENAKYFYDALANDWQHKEYADFSPEADVYKDAQTAYQIALARYNLNVAGINDNTYRSAQAQVAQARASLAALTEDKTVEIAGARQQLAQARASLVTLTEDKTTQIASARQQLAQAEANLVNLLEGASEEKIAIAQAQVEQARIALANAEARLADATLVAPFDGAVTAVNVEIGEWATGQVVELVDTSSLEVVLDVDEIDIGSIAVGQEAIVTLETWPDQDLSGKVVSIAPTGNTTAEIVTYQVHITLNAGDLPVRTGMTANANLITAEQEGVLLVANRAISVDRDIGQYYVHRVQGETVTKVPISVGTRDRNYTQVTSGLEQGDKLVIGYDEQSGLPFGPGQGGGMGMGQ